MKIFNYILSTATAAVIFHCGTVFAQPQPGLPNWQTMDPQQLQQSIQQRMMDNFREQLGVTNDAEWTVIESRLSKLVKLRTETMFGAGMGMMGGIRRSGGPGGFAGFGQTDPDAENLQKSIDDNAPTPQVKAALAKLRDGRKQKQADIAKAQNDLRSIFTTRQEAIMVLSGMLD